MPISRSPYLSFAALAFGAFPTIVGLQLLIYPLSGLSLLGYAIPSDPSTRVLSASLLRYYGARDLTLGMITLAVWKSGDRRTLGFTMALGTTLAIMDGFINQADVSGGAWKHWVLVPVGGLITVGTLGLLDG